MSSLIKQVLVIVGLLIILTLAGVILYLLFSDANPTDKATISLEFAKALLQLVLIIILGTFISELFKSFERFRKQDKALHDFRDEFLKTLQNTNRIVMKSRFSLSVSGLTSKYRAQEGTMSEPGRETYRTEMEILGETQWQLESLEAEILNFPKAFKKNKELEVSIKRMRSYLADLTKEYEKYWPDLSTRPNEVSITKLEELLDFTGDFSSSGFNKKFVVTYNRAIGYIRQELLPISSAKSKD